MVYSNNIFRLLEYEFTDLRYYNSLRLVQEQNYSLEEIEITLDDLYDVWARTKVKPEPAVTFIQADSFYKVISLVERLNENPMTGGEIAQLLDLRSDSRTIISTRAAIWDWRRSRRMRTA